MKVYKKAYNKYKVKENVDFKELEKFGYKKKGMELANIIIKNS